MVSLWCLNTFFLLSISSLDVFLSHGAMLSINMILLMPFQVRVGTLYTVKLTHGHFHWTVKRKYKHFQELHRDLYKHRMMVNLLPLARSVYCWVETY